jgi:concanavalin A-like lectin/glucanase superfamily protein
MALRPLTPRHSLVFPRGFVKPSQPVLDPTHPLSRGLVGCWLLGDNVTSTTQDISGNNYAGTNNSSLLALGPSHHGGLSDTFNGLLTYVKFPPVAPANLFGGSLPFSFSAWVNPSSFPGLNPFILHTRAQNDVSLFYIVGTGFSFGFYDGSSHNATSGAASTGVWYHVVGVWDKANSLLRLYVNGLQTGTVATGTPNTTTDINTIGSQVQSGVPGNTWAGQIEGVRIYNRALSPVEVQQLYAEPYAGIYSAGIPYLIGATGGTGISGSAAWTEAQDTWAGTGTVLVSGSAAWTEAQDIWSGTGTLTSSGSAAWTEAQDAWSGTGTVSNGISGSSAWTEAQDIWAGTGTVLVSGSAAWVEIQDTWAGTGSITLPTISGSAAWTESPDSWNGTGTSGAIGGHFLPISKKAIEKARKEARRIQKARESAWAERAKETAGITEEMAELANPKPKRAILTLPPKPVVQTIEDDDEDAEIELLLLSA